MDCSGSGGGTMGRRGLMVLFLVAATVSAFHSTHRLQTMEHTPFRRTPLLAMPTSKQTLIQPLKTVQLKDSHSSASKRDAAPTPAPQQPTGASVISKAKDMFGGVVAALKHPRTALAIGAGVSLAAASYFYHSWTRPLELEGMLEAMALDLLTSMSLGLETVEGVTKAYQESFPDNDILKFVTFLKEWASSTDEPNIYDVAVVHTVMTTMFEGNEAQRQEIVQAILDQVPSRHQARSLWVVDKTWQDDEKPPALKARLQDPTFVAEYERLDKVAYKQCVRAWLADVMSGTLVKDRVNAMKPPAGYDELGIDIKHAVVQFGNYLEEIVERTVRHDASGRKMMDSIWKQFDKTKRSPTRSLHERTGEEYGADFMQILETLQRDTGTRGIRPLSRQLARLLSEVRYPIVHKLKQAEVVPANPAFVCRECGLLMFVAKGRNFRFVGKNHTCRRCGASKSFEMRDVAEL